MSEEANKALVLRWVEEVFNEGDTTVAEELFSANFILHPSTRRLGRGNVAGERAAFPDLHKSIDLLVAEGDLVVLRATNRGTHLGTFVSPLFGTYPPTGDRVKWSQVTIFRIVGGKIVETWEHINWLQLLEQLGGVVQTSPAGRS